jgi:hypothetical protein
MDNATAQACALCGHIVHGSGWLACPRCGRSMSDALPAPTQRTVILTVEGGKVVAVQTDLPRRYLSNEDAT